MKLWIRLDVAIRSDPNVAELAHRLNMRLPEAVGCCTLLWCAIGEHRPSGDISGISISALEKWAAFEGRKGAAQGSFGPVFLELFANDGTASGWHDRQGALIDRTEKETARKARNRHANVLRTSAVTERNVTEQQQKTEAEPPKYPPDFELLWKAYPKREGSNSKSAALKAYNARLREHTDFTLMQDGTARYAEFARVKAWAGTEFVMQASRFYGPDKAFLEDWAVAAPNLAVVKLWAVMKTYGFANATRFTIDADLARAKADGKLEDGEAFKRTLRKLNLTALRDVRSDEAAYKSIAESLGGEDIEGMAA